MKKTILMAVVFTALVIACKKSDSSSPSVVAKWNLVKQVRWSTPSGGTTTKDTSNYGSGIGTATFDVRTDGKIYINIQSQFMPLTRDTLSYTVDGNMMYTTQIATGNKDTITILNVTNNDLTFYNKRNDFGDLEENWTFFSK
jgi:hypothetical protein